MGCGTVVVIVHAPHGPVLGSIPTLLYGRGRKFLHSTPMAFTFGWHIRSSPMASTLGWDIRSAPWPAFRTTLPRCRYRYRGCLTLHVVPPKSHTYTITYIHNHTHTHTHIHAHIPHTHTHIHAHIHAHACTCINKGTYAHRIHRTAHRVSRETTHTAHNAVTQSPVRPKEDALRFRTVTGECSLHSFMQQTVGKLRPPTAAPGPTSRRLAC